MRGAWAAAAKAEVRQAGASSKRCDRHLGADLEWLRRGDTGAGYRAAVAHHFGADRAGNLLEDHCRAYRAVEHRAGAGKRERCTDVGVAGEGELGHGCEDADARGVSRVLGRQDEGLLGIVELARDRLHLLVRQAACVKDDGERVAAEGPVGEDVDGDEGNLDRDLAGWAGSVSISRRRGGARPDRW